MYFKSKYWIWFILVNLTEELYHGITPRNCITNDGPHFAVWVCCYVTCICVCALYHLIYLQVVYTCYSNPHRLTDFLALAQITPHKHKCYIQVHFAMHRIFVLKLLKFFTSTFLFSLSLSTLLLRNPISLLQSLLFLSPLHLAPFLIPLHGSFPTSFSLSSRPSLSMYILNMRVYLNQVVFHHHVTIY